METAKTKTDGTGQQDIVGAASAAAKIVEALGNALEDCGGKRNDVRHLLSGKRSPLLLSRLASQILFSKHFVVDEDASPLRVVVRSDRPRGRLFKDAGVICHHKPHSSVEDTPFGSSVAPTASCELIRVRKRLDAQMMNELLFHRGFAATDSCEFLSALEQHEHLREIPNLCCHPHVTELVEHADVPLISEVKRGYFVLRPVNGSSPPNLLCIEPGNFTGFLKKGTVLLVRRRV